MCVYIYFGSEHHSNGFPCTWLCALHSQLWIHDFENTLKSRTISRQNYNMYFSMWWKGNIKMNIKTTGREEKKAAISSEWVSNNSTIFNLSWYSEWLPLSLCEKYNILFGNQIFHALQAANDSNSPNQLHRFSILWSVPCWRKNFKHS